MQYCKNCQRLVDGEVCPRCRNTKLRVALDSDFCLVAEVPYFQAEMLKEVFSDNDIPCTERSVLGAGLTAELGVNVGRVRLYVPYDRFEPAQELYRAFFEGAAEPVEDDEPAECGEAGECGEPAGRELLIGQVYRHFKGGLYRVEDVATHSETLEEYVVYRRLYGDGSLWIRPKEMFLSPVDREKYPDAMQAYRFEPVDAESADDPE